MRKIASLKDSLNFQHHSQKSTLCTRHGYIDKNGRMTLRERFNFSDLQFSHRSNEGHAIQLVWLLWKWRWRDMPSPVGGQWTWASPPPSDHICPLGTLEKWHNPTQFYCVSLSCLSSWAKCLEAYRRHFLDIFVYLRCLAQSITQRGSWAQTHCIKACFTQKLGPIMLCWVKSGNTTVSQGR